MLLRDYRIGDESFTDINLFSSATSFISVSCSVTKKYAQTMLGWGQKIQIRFTKVPAHSKVKYNELADETAKLGVANGNGIPKVKSLSDFEAADGVEA